MAKNQRSKATQALVASLFSQLRQPHELAKLTTLLIVLGHIKARAGYDLMADGEPQLVDKRRNRTKKKQGYTIKTPRSRFL